MGIVDVFPAKKSAEAVLWALNQHYPEETEIIESYLKDLFAAFYEGHSCILVNAKDMAKLSQAHHLVTSHPQSGLKPLVLQDKQLFLAKMWQLEQDIAHAIWRKLACKASIAEDFDANVLLANYFPDTESAEQKLAAALALLNTIMIITGGPGTGKTTTVAKILLMLLHMYAEDNPPSIALVAPTGKAAARMTEALQSSLQFIDAKESYKDRLQKLQGMTLHRFLKIYPPKLQTPYHENNPVPYDIVVVDEASMVDLGMMKQLLCAMSKETRLIILGDNQQLPSVGAGAILASFPKETIISSEQESLLKQWVPEWIEKLSVQQHISLNMAVASLTYSHRFNDQAGVGRLAKLVLAAEPLQNCFDKFSTQLMCEPCKDSLLNDFYLLQQRYWQAIADKNIEQAFSALSDTLVLAIYRQDIKDFNQNYREFLTKKGKANLTTWFSGQVIMLTSNDYVLNVFNGDIAIVLEDNSGSLQAYVPSEDGFRGIPLSRLPSYEDAFAITVHKSQGSEAKSVWLIGPENSIGQDGLFNQALLYTAITRAKENFKYWGSMQSLESAAKRNEERRTGLKTWLTNSI